MVYRWKTHLPIPSLLYHWRRSHWDAVPAYSKYGLRRHAEICWSQSTYLTYSLDINVHREPKNKTPNSCPYTRQILTNFRISSTAKLSKKFAVKRSLQITPHLKDVATLPCETLVFKNCTDRKHSNDRLSAHAVDRMWLRKMSWY